MGNNEWLDIEVLDDYLEGKLDAGMMHKVERISLEDPFVAQALAGLTAAKKRTHTLSILQQQLQERVAEKPAERKMWRITSHRLSIAATAAVLFLTVSILFWMRENYRRQQAELASRKVKNVEVELKPEVAATTPLETLAVATAKISAAPQNNIAESVPQSGWPHYREYLKHYNKLFTSGSLVVELTFDITKDGTPSNIKVVKGQTKEINEAAIRLLKEGPKWSYDSKLANKGTIAIHF